MNRVVQRRVESCLASLVLAISQCLWPPAEGTAQRAARDGQAWLDAVKNHVPGERDEAVAQLAPWSLAELESAARILSRQPDADRLGLIARALVLHSDTAILNRGTDGYDLPARSTGIIVYADGRTVGETGGTVHWEFARRLLNRAPRGDDRLQLGRRFYRAAGAMLQHWGEDPELSTHLTAGRRLLGDDAVLLLYEGTQRLAYAGSRAQRFFDELRASAAARPPVPANRSVVGPPREARDEPWPPPSVQDSRARAERFFRRALVIDASLVEARIRLAHVLVDTDRHDEAVSELEAAVRSPLPRLLDYYASLMLGRAQRARRQFDAARAAFERASSVYPTAPAPRLGLSELAMARGDRTRSLEYLLSGATATRAQVTEPWWTIEWVHEPSAETLIADLRRVR